MGHFSRKYNSPIGELTITATENSIIELLLPGQNSRFRATPVDCTNHDPIKYAIYFLDRYFRGEHLAVDTQWLNPNGTEFQMQVWQMLAHIPYGQTTTYGEIASEICQKNNIRNMSAQAVGQAVGKNPVPILLPCHRVIGANGKLTGYAGGLSQKLLLLQHEGLYKEKVL